MRLVSAFLFVALTGSAVIADEAKPADPKPEVTKKKVPYRVVTTLPETGQVLLFDRDHGTHVVAEVGQALEGYTVDDIDDDEVTLISESGATVILASPPPPRQARRAAKAKPQQPVDPYVDQAAEGGANPAPVDPYAEPAAPRTPGEGGVRVASAAAPSTATTAQDAPAAPPAAPIVDSGAPELSDPYADPGIAAFAEAVGAPPPATEPAPAPARKGKPGKAPAKKTSSADAASELAAAATGEPAPTAPAVAPAPTGAPTGAPAGSIVIARTELDAALGDFTRTAGTFRAAFTPDGLRFDAVAAGSLLAKVGLRKGDVVTYVDGKPLRSLDDAAALYARAGSLRATTIQVAREGKNVTLRVAIQ